MVAATTLTTSADEAFERLFAAEYRRVVSVAYRILRDAAEAEDVAQEVFARCARLSRAPSRGWLYVAAAHGALNIVRSRKRRAVREQRDVALRLPVEHAAQAGVDPQQVAERRSDVQRVRDALARIPPHHAEVLALRYSGCSYREISEALNVDLAQVGTRLARAERAFKKEMES